MIAVRLVHLVETHCDEIADGVLKKFQLSPRTSDLRKVSPQELRQRTVEVLRHLSDWLLCKSKSEIERRYREMGCTRASQKVSLADFCWSMIFTKEQIWNFVQQQGYLLSPLEIYGEMELLRSLDQFFDAAIGYGAEGYESAATQMDDGEPLLAEIADDGNPCVPS
jgi:hypothetical protein